MKKFRTNGKHKHYKNQQPVGMQVRNIIGETRFGVREVAEFLCSFIKRKNPCRGIAGFDPKHHPSHVVMMSHATLLF